MVQAWRLIKLRGAGAWLGAPGGVRRGGSRPQTHPLACAYPPASRRRLAIGRPLATDPATQEGQPWQGGSWKEISCELEWDPMATPRPLQTMGRRPIKG